MPEGHTLHRLAKQHRALLVGHVVEASSPQGRFVEGARLIDGREVVGVDAYGKHLFHRFAGLGERLHVHLGLYGKFVTGVAPPPEPRGALRLRLVGAGHYLDLRGPTRCELITPAERTALLARLGPTRCARVPIRPRRGPGSSAAAPRSACC